MTTLARQLQRLAIPHTQDLFATDKQRASLLFDPKEAANLDVEAVFAIGISGLEELENIEVEFSQYEGSLFNQASQSWERGLQTQEVNAKLDQELSAFLIRLSPYFLLKSAQKALEWLIYRFHIHQYNVDDLLTCVFPYHGTNIFVRIVQLLPLNKASDKWHWLEPVQKTGVCLARGSVVRQAQTDAGFLTFVCGLVPRFIKVHGSGSQQLRVVISFCTTTLLGTMQFREAVTEQLVSQVLPSVAQGVKSKCLEFKACAYMILGQLVTLTQVKDTVLLSLLPSITKHVSQKLVTEALVCVVTVYQTQRLEKLPKKSLRHICKMSGVVSILEELARCYQVDQFLQVLLQALVPEAVRETGASGSSGEEGQELMAGPPQYSSILHSVMRHVPMSAQVALVLARCLVRRLLEAQHFYGTALGGAAAWQEKAAPLLQLAERRYPVALDTVLSDYSQVVREEADTQAFQALCSLAVGAAKHQHLPEASSSLVLSLHHPQPHIRLLGLQHLARILQEKQVEVGSSFVCQSLLSRLADDDLQVVKAALEIVQNHKAVEQRQLVPALFRLVGRTYRKRKWLSICNGAIEMLGGEGLNEDMSTASRLLAYAFITKPNPNQLSVAKTVIQSPLLVRSGLVSKLAAEWSQLAEECADNISSETAARLNVLLVDGAAESLLCMAEARQCVTMEYLVRQCEEECRGPGCVAMVMCILGTMTTSARDLKTKTRAASSLVPLLLRHLHHIQQVDEPCKGKLTLEKLFVKCMPQFKTSLPARLLVWLVQQVVKETKLWESFLKGTTWWRVDDQESVEKEQVRMLVSLVDMLMQNSCQVQPDQQPVATSRYLLLDVLKNNFSQEESNKLLAFLWSCDTSMADVLGVHVSPVVQVGAIKIASWLLKQNTADHAHSIMNPDSCVLGSVLVSLSSEQVFIRQSAVEYLTTLKSLCGANKDATYWLVKRLLNNKEEILADASHVAEVLGIVLKPRVDDNQSKQRAHSQDFLQLFLNFLQNVEVPDYMKKALLCLLDRVDNKELLDGLVPLGENVLERVNQIEASSPEFAVQLAVWHRISLHYTPQMAPETGADSNTMRLLCKALKPSMPEGVTWAALQQIKKAWFHALPQLHTKQHLVSCLLQLWLEAATPGLARHAGSTLKQLHLDAEHVTHELEKLVSPPETATVRATRRASGRMQKGQQNSEKARSAWPWGRVTRLLELIQARKKMKGADSIIQQLFSMLNRLLGMEGDDEDEDSAMTYQLQLIMVCLYNLCSRLIHKGQGLQQEVFKVELLVQCIRQCSQVMIQQQALMLMSTVAAHFPDYILDNVMSVFTFMGSSLLQQDDSYSFHVITHTMRTVIPALLRTGDEDELEQTMVKILRVFVDARQHLPKHRCLLVLHTLVETLGAEGYLWKLLLLLVENSVTGTRQPQQQLSAHLAGLQSEDESPGELLLSVCEHFPVHTQVKSATNLLGYVQSLLTKYQWEQENTKATPKRRPESKEKDSLLDLDLLTGQQVRQIIFRSTNFVVAKIGSQQFISQVGQEAEEGLESLTGPFRDLLEQTLCYVTCISKHQHIHTQGPAPRFSKALLHKAHDILEKVNQLLPTDVLLGVTHFLLQHDIVSVHRKALELLNNKLQELHQQGFTEQQKAVVQSLLELVDPVMCLVRAAKRKETLDGETVAVTQLSLYSIKLLCKLVGHTDSARFTKVLDVVVKVMKQSVAPPVLASSLLCLAELVSTLKAHTIPKLPSFLPTLLSVLKDTDGLLSNELVLVCSITCLQRVVSSLPHFLSPYLQDILYVVCELSQSEEVSEESQKSQSAQRLRAVRNSLSTQIEPRLFIPVVTSCFNKLVQAKQGCAAHLMAVLKEHISNMAAADLAAHQTPLLEMFLTSLDVRTMAGQVTKPDLLKTEGAVISAILGMVIRLSEVDFRPVFYKLFDWATREDSSSKMRIVTFYRLADSLAATLKSLFNLFVSHILQNAASLLDSNNTIKSEKNFFGSKSKANEELSCELLDYILDCLNKCLIYDTEGFVDKDVFNSLMQPLVDQLENFTGGETSYQERVSGHVIPCVSQLAVTLGDDALRKTLNYQVLLKARHTSAKVRFAALKTVENITEKLGDDYMTLLPETIPFLAELMEDESEEVEELCQHVVNRMESVLGESLAKYF